MKNNNIELEKYKFIGDSNVNEAICIRNDGSKHYCTQTDIITALVQNKKYIKGGTKLKLNKDSKNVSYLIDYGTDEKQPKQLIKITFDKNNLLKGDPNALAIDSICNKAVILKKNNIKKMIITGTAAALVGAGIAGAMAVGFAYAAEKEHEIQNEETRQYQKWLEEEEKKNELGLSTGDVLEFPEDTFAGKSF